MTRTRSIHYCNVCDYKTDRKYDRDKHVTRMHGSNVQENVSQASSNIQNYRNSHYGTEQNTHVPTENFGRALNIQHGTGVVREQGNQAFNEVVDIAHRWKNACEKLQEKQLVKDNAINIRDVHLQNQNIKLQEEFVKNNNLHGEYHNALQKIQDLELLNEEICNELDDKIAAMGKDMRKVISENKHLKRKNLKRKNRALNNYSRKRINRALNNYARWKMIQNGNGVKKNFFKTKAPTTLQIGRAGSLAPSTISVSNNGTVQYRGEKGIQQGSGIFRGGEVLQRNRGIGGMMGRPTSYKKKVNNAKLNKEIIRRLLEI